MRPRGFVNFDNWKKRNQKQKKLENGKKKIGNLDCQSQTTSPQTLLAWKEILKWVSKIEHCEKVLRHFKGKVFFNTKQVLFYGNHLSHIIVSDIREAKNFDVL